MRLVSMLTEGYVPRARPFLKSLSRLTGTDPHVIGLGFSFGAAQDFEREFICKGFPGFDFVVMPRHWSESSCGIMQHGRWLDALPDVRDDEVYIISDADIIVQRDFTPEERQRFEGCGENEFLVGWNAGQGDSLVEEAGRIGFTDDGTWTSPWGDDDTPYRSNWKNIPCFNTGILAMRGRNWRRLRDLYESRCERFYKLTTHRSRGQWLINFCLARLGMTPSILSTSTHGHGHFGIPPDVTINDGIAYYRGKMVLFRHAF